MLSLRTAEVCTLAHAIRECSQRDVGSLELMRPGETRREDLLRTAVHGRQLLRVDWKQLIGRTDFAEKCVKAKVYPRV